jgi:hypothetical protein
MRDSPVVRVIVTLAASRPTAPLLDLSQLEQRRTAL